MPLFMSLSGDVVPGFASGARTWESAAISADVILEEHWKVAQLKPAL